MFPCSASGYHIAQCLSGLPNPSFFHPLCYFSMILKNGHCFGIHILGDSRNYINPQQGVSRGLWDVVWRRVKAREKYGSQRYTQNRASQSLNVLESAQELVKTQVLIQQVWVGPKILLCQQVQGMLAAGPRVTLPEARAQTTGSNLKSCHLGLGQDAARAFSEHDVFS